MAESKNSQDYFYELKINGATEPVYRCLKFFGSYSQTQVITMQKNVEEKNRPFPGMEFFRMDRFGINRYSRYQDEFLL